MADVRGAPRAVSRNRKRKGRRKQQDVVDVGYKFPEAMEVKFPKSRKNDSMKGSPDFGKSLESGISSPTHYISSTEPPPVSSHKRSKKKGRRRTRQKDLGHDVYGETLNVGSPGDDSALPASVKNALSKRKVSKEDEEAETLARITNNLAITSDSNEVPPLSDGAIGATASMNSNISKPRGRTRSFLSMFSGKKKGSDEQSPNTNIVTKGSILSRGRKRAGSLFGNKGKGVIKGNALDNMKILSVQTNSPFNMPESKHDDDISDLDLSYSMPPAKANGVSARPSNVSVSKKTQNRKIEEEQNNDEFDVPSLTKEDDGRASNLTNSRAGGTKEEWRRVAVTRRDKQLTEAVSGLANMVEGIENDGRKRGERRKRRKRRTPEMYDV